MNIEDEVIQRLIISCGHKNKTALAQAYGMTLQNFSNKQRVGTLDDLIITEALKHNVNINYIYTGKGEIYISDRESDTAEKGAALRSPSAPYEASSMLCEPAAPYGEDDRAKESFRVHKPPPAKLPPSHRGGLESFIDGLRSLVTTGNTEAEDERGKDKARLKALESRIEALEQIISKLTPR